MDAEVISQPKKNPFLFLPGNTYVIALAVIEAVSDIACLQNVETTWAVTRDEHDISLQVGRQQIEQIEQCVCGYP